MFDRVIEKPRGSRWKTAVIIGSAVAHAIAAAALVVGALWKIEKLPLAVATRIELAPRPPTGESAPAGGAKLQTIKVAKVVRPAKRVVTEPVQPQVKTVTDAPPATGTDTGGGGGGGTGTDPDGKGTCLVEPCAGVETETPPEEPPPQAECTDKACRCAKDPSLAECRPPVVAPDVAKGLRVAGNEKIYPPESVKVDMLHQGKETVQGVFQICVGADGGVDSVRTMRSTGFRAYDDELTGEMRRWRYRAYRVGGVASPMCTVQVVVYRMSR